MARKAAFGVIKINTGSLEIIAEVRNWRAPKESNEIDTTVMGTGNSSMIPGTIRDGLEMDLFFNHADSAQAFILANLGSDSAYATELYPIGEGSSGETVWKWNANCYIMGATPEGAADGAVEMNGVTFTTDSAGGTWSDVVVP